MIHSSFFIAIIWLCYECTNGSGTDKVSKKFGESSSNSGDQVINASSEKSTEEKQREESKTEIEKTLSLNKSAIMPRKVKKVNNVSDLLLWREIHRQSSSFWVNIWC
ncbi:hypothetical protein niasHT_000697 [Heterodera trifolii]|uniref:Effector protein n=1 Tax=Heterodera trifolii TaxID=157864 RepID=A0ABD2MCP2_9BILA